MCFRETPFTALQQGDINDLLRVSVPVQIIRVIIKPIRRLYSGLGGGGGGLESSALKQPRFGLAEKRENAVWIRYGSWLREGVANGWASEDQIVAGYNYQEKHCCGVVLMGSR